LGRHSLEQPTQLDTQADIPCCTHFYLFHSSSNSCLLSPALLLLLYAATALTEWPFAAALMSQLISWLYSGYSIVAAGKIRPAATFKLLITVSFLSLHALMPLLT